MSRLSTAQTLYSDNSRWLKWVLGAIGVLLVLIIGTKLIDLFFGGESTATIYVLPGFVKFLLLIILLVGGVTTGEKNNPASIILAAAVTGVLFFFFTPTIAKLTGNITGIIPVPLIAGVFLVVLAIIAKKIMETSNLATVLFIGGAIITVLAFGPLVLPKSVVALFAKIELPSTNSITTLGPQLATFGLVRSVLIGALIFFWLKKPLSVGRFLISGLLIVLIHRYATVDALLGEHHTARKAVETQQTVGRNVLGRFTAELTAGDARRDILSHKRIARTGIFHISEEALLCDSFSNESCDKSSMSLNDNLTKVFIIEGKTEIIAGYSWEQVYLHKPGGQKVYVFSGDILTDAKKAKAETIAKKTTALKAAGWVNVLVSKPDSRGFSSVTIPKDAIGKKIVNFKTCLYTQTRSNGVESKIWAPRTSMSFSTPIKEWFVDVKFKKVPADGNCQAKFQ